MQDYTTSALSGPEKVLFAFIQKVNRSPSEIHQEDVDEVKTAGWSEEAIYDTITVCALFNFYDRWVDAAGVSALPAEEITKSVKTWARGYVTG